MTYFSEFLVDCDLRRAAARAARLAGRALALGLALAGSGASGTQAQIFRPAPTIRGDLGQLEPGDILETSVTFLREFARERLDATGDEELFAIRVIPSQRGPESVVMEERINGLSILRTTLLLDIEPDGKVEGLTGTFVSSRGLSAQPSLSAEAALEIATAGLESPAGLPPYGDPELVYAVGNDERAHLCWYVARPGPVFDRVYADARTGALVARDYFDGRGIRPSQPIPPVFPKQPPVHEPAAFPIRTSPQP